MGCAPTGNVCTARNGVHGGVMASTRNIALNFLAVKAATFTYTVYRKKLAPDQDSVPGTRDLPDDCLSAPAPSVERHRYEVSLQPKDGFERTQIGAWINQGLTDEVLHQALLSRVQQADLQTDTELSERKFTQEIAFVLGRHGDVREVMWLRAYGLQVLRRFGFLCQFALRVPRHSTIPDKRRLGACPSIRRILLASEGRIRFCLGA